MIAGYHADHFHHLVHCRCQLLLMYHSLGIFISWEELYLEFKQELKYLCYDMLAVPDVDSCIVKLFNKL